MRKLYAGIGSRNTPPDVLEKMQEFAYHAAQRGWTLRSGGADGADTAFEMGCDDGQGKKEIFLPWAKFNGNASTLFGPSGDAMRVAAEIHPAWKVLLPAARKLCARNMHQIMGPHMREAVSCVVCWTPDGCESHENYSRTTGGTGTAIALASVNNIPIFNLKNTDRYIDAIEFLLLN